MDKPKQKRRPHSGQFKPGNCANPLGGLAHNPETRAIKQITAKNVAEIGSLIVTGSLDELAKIAQDPSETVLRVWMAKIAIDGIQKGNTASLDLILNRIVGKVKEQVDVNASGSLNIPNVDTRKLAQTLKKIDDDL